MPMTKKQRVRAAVRGEQPDQVPYSLWSHMPGIDLDADAITEKTVEFYRTYDIDFIKTMNNGMYAIEDFGCEIDYSEIPKGGVARLVTSPIDSPADWETLQACPLDKGSLARELHYLEMLLERVKGEEVPVIFTVFSPATIADKLSGKKFVKHIEEGYGQQVKAALEVITETTANLAREAIRMGADGVFFASQMSTYDAMTDVQYLEYGRPYDLRVLEAAGDGWLNTIHCHGNNIMYDLLKDYPVQVFNWHAWEALPAIDEALILGGKCLMGGLNRSDITACHKNEIRNQIYNCMKITNGRHLILTPGCVIRYPLNDAMLGYVRATKNAVESALF